MGRQEIDIDLLKQEYFHLQKVVDDYDQKALNIKAWSVTVSMAGIGLAFSQKIPVLLILAAAASVLFWIIETYWKLFQFANYRRLETIELYMHGEPLEDFVAPDINHSWRVGYQEASFIKISFWPQVYLPHFVIVIGGTVLWLADFLWKFMPRNLSPLS